MTDIYVPGHPDAFRVVPSRPNYAITKKGEVLSIRTNAILVPDEGTFWVHERVERPGHLRTSDIDVRVFMAEVYPEINYAPTEETATYSLWALALKLANGDKDKAKALIDEADAEHKKLKSEEKDV